MPPEPDAGTPETPENEPDKSTLEAAKATQDDDKLGAGGKRALESERAARKANEAALKEAQSELKKLQDRDKSETERAQAAATEAENARKAAESKVRDLTLGQALRDEAMEQGARKAGGVAKLVDTSGIDVNDDGDPNPRDVKRAIAAVRTEYPELFAPGGGNGSADGGSRTAADGSQDMSQLIRQGFGRG